MSKQKLVKFRHHFLFGVPSKISSSKHYFTNNTLGILFRFVCPLGNVPKAKKFDYKQSVKVVCTYISFERMVHNIQKKLLLNGPFHLNM